MSEFVEGRRAAVAATVESGEKEERGGRAFSLPAGYSQYYLERLGGGGNAAVQRKAEDGAPSAASHGDGGGASDRLPGAVEAQMERSFGADFSSVRVHQDGVAQSLGAKALARGDDVHFAPGQYSPSTEQGRSLIGHELAHVVQQRSGRVSSAQGKDAPYVEDAHLEREADEMGARAARGEPAGANLGVGARTSGTTIQRQQQTPDITPQELQAAIAWATTERIAQALVREIQGAVGVAVSGNYDEATARGVYARQREWQPRGAIAHAGQARPAFCARLGLIFYREAQTNAVGDAELDQIRQRFPNGVTVALYAGYAEQGNNAEFARKAREFATNQQAVGLNGTNIALGVPMRIQELGDVMTIVTGIHRSLLAKYRATQSGGQQGGQQGAQGAQGGTDGGAGGGGGGGGAGTGGNITVPAFTKVHNLALFAHGTSHGMGMNAGNDFGAGGLHNNARGVNPSNVEAFARGLSEGVTSDIRVQMFACSTASDGNARSQAWLEHEQGASFGQDSLAASLAQSLGPDATVSAHTTVGHTTENYAARVFGRDAHQAGQAQGETGGLHLFDVMYDEAFIQSELQRLFPGRQDLPQLHDPLREQMWGHYRASIGGSRASAYPVPMGQESFVNPDNAKRLLREDWAQNWIPTRLRNVQPRRS